jgi:hypothetical protein
MTLTLFTVAFQMEPVVRDFYGLFAIKWLVLNPLRPSL